MSQKCDAASKESPLCKGCLIVHFLDHVSAESSFSAYAHSSSSERAKAARRPGTF